MPNIHSRPHRRSSDSSTQLSASQPHESPKSTSGNYRAPVTSCRQPTAEQLEQRITYLQDVQQELLDYRQDLRDRLDLHGVVRHRNNSRDATSIEEHVATLDHLADKTILEIRIEQANQHMARTEEQAAAARAATDQPPSPPATATTRTRSKIQHEPGTGHVRFAEQDNVHFYDPEEPPHPQSPRRRERQLDTRNVNIITRHPPSSNSGSGSGSGSDRSLPRRRRH